ncbi:hypothetical protein C9994_06420 [Marivirga lumbricoides]|uniref:PKD domain-containing protein n=1 Tax=Marivirga lumbricoides TaxID=1046115 RepID=A0A2T4DS92_9BACT|nr:hypothetical protein C9994_06420 [Marivirga lumbricoides]
MKRLSIIYFTFISFSAYAQIPIANFNDPEDVCLQEELDLINTSQFSNTYIWDFCPGDFNNNVSANLFYQNNLLTGVANVTTHQNNLFDSIVYTFIGSGNGEMYLSIGNPQSYNLANLEGIIKNNVTISRPTDIDLIQIDSIWFGYIVDVNNSRLYEIEFGYVISHDIKEIKDLGSYSSMNRPYGIKAAYENDTLKLMISNFNGPNLTYLKRHKNDDVFINQVISTGRGNSFGIDLIKFKGEWLASIAYNNSNVVTYLNFGETLTNSYKEIFEFTQVGFTNPTDVKLIVEHDTLYSFVPARSSGFFSLKFGLEFNNSPLVTPYGNLAIMDGNSRAVSFFKNLNSEWQGVLLSQSTNVFKLNYENFCISDSKISDLFSPSPSYSAPGTYPISLTAFDDEGNSSSITKEITVTNNTAPEIDFETGANLCITDPISFKGISNESISSWNWDFGDGNTATGQNTEFTFTSPGTYEVILEVEGANGCNNRIKKSITVYEPLPVTFSSSAQGAICSQKPTLFTNTTDSPPISTYEWSFGDGTTSTEENPEHVYQSAGDYTVRLSVAFAGCESFAEQTITVNPGPEVSFSTIDNCLGQSISFNNTSSGDFISSYLWDFGDGTTSTQENPEYTFEAAGVKNISLTAFTTNGCDYTIQQNIEVFPVAVVDFEVEIACATQPVQFNEQVFLELSNVTDYLWDFGIAGRTDDISTFANPQFTFPEAGTYQVSLQVTTADGCVSNKQKTVMVNPVPEPLFTYTPKCVGNSITFNGNSNEEVASQYWELSNSKGEVVSVGANENFTYIFLNTGNYTLRYRQQNQQLCSNEYEETIRILPNPVPSFAVSQLCLGSSITFQNTTDLKGNTLESYNWLIDGELVSNDENAEFTFEEAGNYTIVLEAITASGCIETTSQTITIEPIPSVNFTLEQLVGAYPFPVTTKVDSVAGFSYKWSINNQVVSTTSVLNEVLETAGTYFINLLVTNPEGCTVTSSQQVRVRAPELDFSLANLRIVPSDDFTEFVVSITNKGSIIPQEVDLIVDFGAYSITERVDRTINPESTINYALNTKLSQNQLKRLSRICLSASIKSNIISEEKKSDNRVCNNLESTFKIMDLYPNPSTTQLTIPLIIPEKGNILVNLEQADGKQNRQYSYNLEDGYNEITLERGNLKAGVYFVRISYQGKEEMKKVVFR